MPVGPRPTPWKPPTPLVFSSVMGGYGFDRLPKAPAKLSPADQTQQRNRPAFSSSPAVCVIDPKRVRTYSGYRSYIVTFVIATNHSMVISMRLPLESGRRLKRMARRHGWTPSDASARLVEE